jgi:outer membrane protein
MEFTRASLLAIFFTAVALALSGCATNGKAIYDKPIMPCVSKNECRKIRNNTSSSALVGAVDLDLGLLIDIALENNPETKRSWHLARVARAHIGQANSAFYPTVVLSGQVSRSESTVPGEKSKQKTFATSYYPSVEIHYSLLQFTANKHIADAAKQALCAANYQHNRAIQTVVYNVQRAYFAFCSAKLTVAANEYNLNDATAAYEAAFMRHQSGLINVQEYLQAKANKSQAEFELEQSRSHVEAARAALANAAGIEISSGINVLHLNIPKDISAMERSIDGIIGEVVRTRQDIAAAHASLQMKKSLLHSAEKKNFPGLIFGFSGSKKKYSHAGGFYNNFGIFAGIEWTIFDGFKKTYDILEARENLEIARQELRATELRAQSEVWTHYFAFKSAGKQLQASRIFERSAAEAFEAAEASFGNGLCKFTELVSAQSCLANARKQRVLSENNLLRSLSDLAYSTGGVVEFNLIHSE